MAYAHVRYKYRRPNMFSWTSTSWSGHVGQESETLVMQKLRQRHSGCEIELMDIRWKA